MHVENGIYDGIFFHRVIDDFVTQAEVLTCKNQVCILQLVWPVAVVGGAQYLLSTMKISHMLTVQSAWRSQEPDSADTQWYIAETEAHGLDPENRDDEGYAFGIVRNGMSHVRAIATVPTTETRPGKKL